MTEIKEELQKKLNELIGELDFSRLYKSYIWKHDSWERGFPDILRLEMEISLAAYEGRIVRDHLIAIANWGGLPNKGGIQCPDPLGISLYQENGLPTPYLYDEPDHAVSIIRAQVKGFGPTYIAKLLRFMSPYSFGALDTRLVRVFGYGNPDVQKIRLLNLTTTQTEGRWAISTTSGVWPKEYGTWVGALRYLANALNRSGISCPHPEAFVEQGLRNKENAWVPADVEMALFTYASQRIQEMKQ
jgi:hypothetical protein